MMKVVAIVLAGICPLAEGLVSVCPADPTQAAGGSTDRPYVMVAVRPSQSLKPYERMASDGKWVIQHKPIKGIVASVYGVSPFRVILNPGVSTTALYDVDIAVQPGTKRDEMRAKARSSVLGMLRVSVEETTRQVPVYVLVRDKSKPLNLPAGDSDASAQWDTGYFKATSASIETLAATLEERLSSPVLDETGLQGNFKFDIRFRSNSPKDVGDSLAPLGFKLISTRKDIDVLIVEKANP